MGLRQACARYYKRRFDVDLDPSDEIIATMGSKEGFANLAQAITAPGDIIYAPDPSYPLHAYGFIIAGAKIQGIPAITADEYLAGVKEALAKAEKPPMAIVVCFPSNPTGQVCDLVEGAKDCMIIETTSLSKTYSMAGWRMGFAVGNKKLIAALARVKSYLDYGAFTPIQVAACAALDGPQDNVEHARAIYRARRDVMVDSFARAGWDIPSPDASMFTWVPLPDDFKHMGSVEFSKNLMREAAVAVSPGVGFGDHGEGYVRIALVENEQRIRQAARNIKAYFARIREESQNAAE